MEHSVDSTADRSRPTQQLAERSRRRARRLTGVLLVVWGVLSAAAGLLARPVSSVVSWGEHALGYDAAQPK